MLQPDQFLLHRIALCIALHQKFAIGAPCIQDKDLGPGAVLLLQLVAVWTSSSSSSSTT